jgi:hypothetical protein
MHSIEGPEDEEVPRADAAKVHNGSLPLIGAPLSEEHVTWSKAAGKACSFSNVSPPLNAQRVGIQVI